MDCLFYFSQMDLNSFLDNSLSEVNLPSNFVLKICDPSTVSYIQPFCFNVAENSIIGYIYVSIICMHLTINKLKNNNTFFFRKSQLKKL